VILYPAIDLKDGRCVRAIQGDLARITVFPLSPAEQAMAWAGAGFAWLHVVDLSGSVEGRSVNGEAVRAILAAVSIPVQLGGGIRSLAEIETWLEAGVRRVVLGTLAAHAPETVAEACRRWPSRIAAALDLREGRIAIEGWTREAAARPLDLAQRLEQAGVAALVVTDIARDGSLSGVDPELYGTIADAVAIPVIAAGGVATVDDIRRLKARPGRPLAGAVLGRALYVGTLAPADALAAAC
jgi:phosphoribosylformimino-5-aminoimidazole carboxamide ribotide isomerase